MQSQSASCRVLSPGLLLLLTALSWPTASLAQGTNSCAGNNACTGADLAMIGNNSCNGSFACYYLHPTVPLVGSCNGDNACSAANTIGLTVTMGPNSCNGFSACQTQNNPNPVVTIGANSCNQDYACPAWHGMFRVDDNSCIGFFACQNGGGAVGSSSCIGNQACVSRFFGFTVNNRSCVGDRACASNNANVGNDSCAGNNACAQTSSRIGNMSCNGQGICFQAQAEVPDCAFNEAVPMGCTNPDLRITNSDGVTRALQGGMVTYTIVAGNFGANPDPTVTVTDAFPAALTGCSVTSVAAGGATGNDAGPTGSLNDTGINLPAGSSVTYTATCTVSPAAIGTLANTATLTASGIDPVPGNNSATDTDTLGTIVLGFATVAGTDDGVLAEDGLLAGGTTQLLVDFSAAMAPDVANPAHYRLFAPGPNGSIDTAACGTPLGDDIAIAVSAVAYSTAQNRAAVSIAGPLALGRSAYRLDVCATAMDQSGFGITPASRSFVVIAGDRLAQPNFDVDLNGWTLVDPVPASLQWSSSDASGATSSGSAGISTAAGAGQIWQLSQCIALSDRYSNGRLRTRIQSATAGAPIAQITIEHVANADCTGASLGTLASPPVEGDTASMWAASTVQGPVPRATQSALVTVRVDGGAATTFVVNLDDLFYGDLETVLADSFE